VKNGRANFEMFKKDLREKLSQSVNPDIILKDVKGEFDEMILQYKQWYEVNKESTLIFEPHNPYRLMLELVLSTEKEIQKYSPKSKPGRKVKELKSYNKLFKDPIVSDKVKEIFEKKGFTKNGIWVKDPNRSNNGSELLSAFYVLRPLFGDHDKTPSAKLFYKEFGVDPLSDRMMSNQPLNRDKERFEKLFSDLLIIKKK
jgi:hypothetical protein